MKDEIKEILDKLKNHIEGIRYANLTKYELRILLDYITNLQEELKSANESISWWQNRFNAVEKQNNRLKGENQDIKDTLQDKLDYIGHLKELCDKYEEEHSTAFNLWKTNIIENVPALSDMQEKLEDYKSRNEKAIEYIKIGLANEKEAEELLNILNGDNK
jgi:DNA repair exonuclease SbcCD ATPase subunit